MSFHEKSTAAMLAIFVLVYGWYFAKVLPPAAAGPVESVQYRALLFGMIILLVVLGAIAHLLIALLAPRDSNASDERDKFAELRGDQVGGYVLATFVLGALALAMLDFEQFWIAHALLGGMVLAEIGKAAAKLLVYRGRI